MVANNNIKMYYFYKSIAVIKGISVNHICFALIINRNKKIIEIKYE